jgi:hypothetical protein
VFFPIRACGILVTIAVGALRPPNAHRMREFGLVLPTGDKYPHKGRFVADSYEFSPATQTVEVIVEFPNPSLLLRPGLNVTLQSSVRAK